jgi:hypothetical protein
MSRRPRATYGQRLVLLARGLPRDSPARGRAQGPQGPAATRALPLTLSADLSSWGPVPGSLASASSHVGHRAHDGFGIPDRLGEADPSRAVARREIDALRVEPGRDPRPRWCAGDRGVERQHRSATVTRLANGKPLSRSSVARAPARMVRRRSLPRFTPSKTGTGRIRSVLDATSPHREGSAGRRPRARPGSWFPPVRTFGLAARSG